MPRPCITDPERADELRDLFPRALRLGGDEEAERALDWDGLAADDRTARMR